MNDRFANVAKRYLDFQQRKMKAGAISAQEYVRLKGIVGASGVTVELPE
jgi:hypothetical protein